MATVSYATTGGSSAKTLPQVADYLLWYAKDRKSGEVPAVVRTAHAA